MYATIRRYDGVDTTRTAELTRKVDETLVPKLRDLDGFGGYYVAEAGNGVMASRSASSTPASRASSRRESRRRGFVTRSSRPPCRIRRRSRAARSSRTSARSSPSRSTAVA